MALKTKQKLKNCSNCGKLFIQTHGEKLCRECTIQEEEKQREIMDYIHDHQGCSITEVIENLNVSKKLIKNMIIKDSSVTSKEAVHLILANLVVKL